MTTALIARIEKNEAAARALLAEGFASKAAQGRARELASRNYSDAKSLIDGLYDLDIPYETNNFRTKHADLMRKRLPNFAAEIALVERAVALYVEIKAAPIAPKAEPKRMNDGGMLAMRSDAFNPVLKAEFLKRAPEIKADYIREVRAVAKVLAEKFGDKIPMSLSHRATRSEQADHSFFSQHADHVKNPDWIRGGGHEYHLILDEGKVERSATRYGELVALQWFYKTNAKLGELADAALVRESSGDVIVRGTKADGSKVEMNQQRVLKRAPVHGHLFNQFPSHLYVDGKFHTAAAYAKRFADATAEA